MLLLANINNITLPELGGILQHLKSRVQLRPTSAPTLSPTLPTSEPTTEPSYDPTQEPTNDPTKDPTVDQLYLVRNRQEILHQNLQNIRLLSLH